MSHFLYKMHSHGGSIIYVGITSDVKRRLKQHAEKFWFGEVAWVETAQFETRAELEAAERELIASLKPKYNKTHNPKRVKDPGRSVSIDRKPGRREMVSIPQAAEYAGVCTRTIRRYISAGRITGYRLGPRLIRVDLNELDDILRPMAAATPLVRINGGAA